jgi:preprotein translocase subunit YajC
MFNFAFLLEGGTTTAPSGAGLQGISSLIMIGGLLVVFYFFMIRPQKKQEKKDAEMRDSLQVGDEVTTIGGIIGKVVSIKEETFVLETTKEKTHIRFLKGAIRSVDVRIADLTGATETPVQETPAEEQPKKFGFFKKNK